MTGRSKIFALLATLWSAFIFSNSFKPGAVSTNISGGFVSFILDLLQKIGFNPDTEILTIFVRKSAHIIEFLILAILVCLCYTQSGKAIKFYCFTILFFCLAVAVTDEFIQLYVANRSSEVRDIVIDFSGSVAGVVFMWLITGKKYNRRRR